MAPYNNSTNKTDKPNNNTKNPCQWNFSITIDNGKPATAAPIYANKDAKPVEAPGAFL